MMEREDAAVDEAPVLCRGNPLFSRIFVGAKNEEIHDEGGGLFVSAAVF